MRHVWISCRETDASFQMVSGKPAREAVESVWAAINLGESLAGEWIFPDEGSPNVPVVACFSPANVINVTAEDRDS
jgi:hypothetical protein